MRKKYDSGGVFLICYGAMILLAELAGVIFMIYKDLS